MNRIESRFATIACQAFFRRAGVVCGLLLGLSPHPAQAQLHVVHGSVGSSHRVTTQKAFTMPGFYNWINGPTYKLSGEAQVGAGKADYETPWTSKLTTVTYPGLPPMAFGTNEFEGRGLIGAYHSYRSYASSGIKTDPLGITLSVGPVDAGLVAGVQAELEVEAGIEPIDPPGWSVYTYAQANVYDPFAFHNFDPDDALQLSSTLKAGGAFSVQGDPAHLLHSLIASTDIPGLELLYRLDITANGTGSFTGTAADAKVDVSFLSNPSLGLLDADVIASILNALTFDDAAGQFVLTADVTLFNGLIAIPDNVRDFNLSLNEVGIASNTTIPPIVGPGGTVSQVPEPSSLTLLLAGLLPLLALRKRAGLRRTQR